LSKRGLNTNSLYPPPHELPFPRRQTVKSPRSPSLQKFCVSLNFTARLLCFFSIHFSCAPVMSPFTIWKSCPAYFSSSNTSFSLRSLTLYFSIISRKPFFQFLYEKSFPWLHLSTPTLSFLPLASPLGGWHFSSCTLKHL